MYPPISLFSLLLFLSMWRCATPSVLTARGAVVLGEVSLEDQHLHIENARVKDELDCVCALAGNLLDTQIHLLQHAVH